MAATTISRATWVDDTGSGNGSVLNNARLQADIYDKIDAVLAGNIIIGGRISSEGFGIHAFSAGGTGGNILHIRNTVSGSSYAQVLLGNNVDSAAADLAVTSSAWPGDIFTVAGAGTILRSSVAGGLNVVAAHASGPIRMYANAALAVTLSSSLLSSSVSLDVSNTLPSLRLVQSNGSSDAKRWHLVAFGDTLHLQSVNDAQSVATNVLRVGRSGTAISFIDFHASVTPNPDATHTLGTASQRWSEIYAFSSVHIGSASLQNDNDDLKVFTSFSGTQNRWTFLRGGRLNPGSDNTNAIGDTTARVAGLFLAPGPLGGVRLIDGVDSARLWYDDGTNEVVISVNSIDVMRADTSSAVFGKSTFAAANQAPIGVNRTGSDGDLVTFSKDGSTQGAISVSGATVSYGTFCGVHYTQLQEGQAEPTLGTLMVSTGRLIDEHASIDAKYVYVEASNHRAQRGVYGVWSGLLTEDGSGYAWARPGAIFQVASLGLFHIRVTDTGGRISNGDYLQASWRPGLAERQLDPGGQYVPTLLDSTVAKALVDVDWTEVVPNDEGVRETLIPCTIHAG